MKELADQVAEQVSKIWGTKVLGVSTMFHSLVNIEAPTNDFKKASEIINRMV